MHQFNDLSLPVQIQAALKAMKYEHPTPIQAKAIPVVLDRRDLIGCAQTGAGKTAAFCIPMVSRLLRIPKKTALILVPTRELANQILDVLNKLTVACPEIKSALLVGGMSMPAQVKDLQKNPRIVVATPERLVDHIKRGNMSLSSTEILVLTEADRMLELGFSPQLSEILRFLPRTRQTLFFSATLPQEIEKLSARFLRDPVRVEATEVEQPIQKILQSVVQTTASKKNDTLVDELNLRKGSVLIFARSQVRTDKVARYLEESGHQVTQLHSGRTQGERNSAVAGFKEGRFRILVATDLGARGVDISHIAHVINYDLPQAPEDYVTRIGRTARAGAEGQTVSLLTPEDRAQWREISALLAKTGTSSSQTRNAVH